MLKCMRIISRSSGVRRTVEAADLLIGLEVVAVALLGLGAAGALLSIEDGDGRDCDLSCFGSVVDLSSFECEKRHSADFRRLGNNVSFGR